MNLCCLRIGLTKIVSRYIFLLVVLWQFSFDCSLLHADDRKATTTSQPQNHNVIAFEAFDYSLGSLRTANRGIGWKQPWLISRVTPPVIAITPTESKTVLSSPSQTLEQRSLQIQGTVQRNNPLRRELVQALSDQQIFVRFELFYRGVQEGLPEVDPEFFVLWLDRLGGGDRTTHSANVPNIGVRFADAGPQKGRNVFMVRIGPAQTAWSKVELRENRSYQIVGRLSKSKNGTRADYDRFDLWIDPGKMDLNSPDATISGAQSISMVQWVGFATGLKTEATDRIHVDNLVLGKTWESVLDGSEALNVANQRRGYNGLVWNKPIDFKRDIYPLLNSLCFDCHAGTNPDSGFRLDLHRELLGYSTGEALAEPGRGHESRLINAVTAVSDEDRMPPDGDDRLTDNQVAMLLAWIDQGLKWDDELLPPLQRESDHWAFQAIAHVVVPQVEKTEWARNPIDAFIAKTHSEMGLKHAPEATRQTLVRRLYLDLIGLPPTTEQSEEFMQDTSPDAYERLVERLLNSPHYGERWGRYWLDLARWAESQGYQHDIVRPYAWRYRDYVINSFNDDKPYDRFLKEQLAGDEIQPYSDENLIATGFLGAARISGNQEDDAIQRNDVLVDIVNATGSVMLGLTLECAQCHNHKFDPVSQRDYYRLQGFFVNGQLGNLSLQEPQTQNPTEIKQWIPDAAYKFYMKEVNTLVKKKLFESTKKPHTWGFHSPATSDSKIERLPVVNRKPIVWQPTVLMNTEPRIFIRGNVSDLGPVVRSGWPEVLGVTPSSLGDNPRSTLADWMADPQNPLVARVWVNRLWQYHFGRGIVETPSDFGVKGAMPTHPELLDWLATELISNDWSTKHIHRQIVTSSTYRQLRKHDKANAMIDPNNKLLWCWPRRRLSAEAIRDSVLVATGELDHSIGGPSVPQKLEEANPRRTIYMFQQRSNMPSVMELFDAPSGIASCSRRAVSTVALQPLFMLNSPFMANRASRLADIVRDIAGDSTEKQIEVAFERTLSRAPDNLELNLARKILQAGTAESTVNETNSDQHPLKQLCHALLNLNEFVYIP